MRKLISLAMVGCLLVFGTPAVASSVDSLEDLKFSVSEQLTKPDVEETVDQLFMALQFQLGSVEHAAHFAGTKAYKGVLDLSRVTPEIDRLNAIFDKVHNVLIYRITDRAVRFRAIDRLLEVRRLAIAMVHVVIEKADAPNLAENTKRYEKAAKTFKESLVKLFQSFPK